jgi:hypothetical protein
MNEISAKLREAFASGEFYLSLRMDPNDFGCNDYDDPEDSKKKTRKRSRGV